MCLQQCLFCAGCLDLMYVEDLKSRKEGLEFLEAIGKGKHLEGSNCLLEKVAALIIDPLSPGIYSTPYQICASPASTAHWIHLHIKQLCDNGFAIVHLWGSQRISVFEIINSNQVLRLLIDWVVAWQAHGW